MTKLILTHTCTHTHAHTSTHNTYTHPADLALVAHHLFLVLEDGLCLGARGLRIALTLVSCLGTVAASHDS